MKIIDLMKKNPGVLIGMVHTLPLPDTMNYGGSMDAVISKAVSDAKTLEQSGFDALLVEPTLDRPIGMTRGTLQAAAMAIICSHIRQEITIPMGVSFFVPDCEDLFAVARASGADFVRLNAFVDTVRFPSGTVTPCAARAWEVRRDKRMQDIAILADIQVKHAKMVYPDVTIEQSAFYAQEQGADALIVTGSTTGEETPMETIRRAAAVSRIPVVVGSGITAENIGKQLEYASGFIVGSSLKPKGNLACEVDPALAGALVKARNSERR